MIARFPYEVSNPDILETIYKYRAMIDEVHKIWEAFAKKVGARTVFANHCVRGVAFDEHPGAGWYHKKHDPQDVFVPRTTALRKEMESLPNLPDLHEFSHMLGYDPLKGRPSGAFAYACFVVYNDRVYLSLPDYYLTQKPLPEGLEEIKLSEFQEIVKKMRDHRD